MSLKSFLKKCIEYTPPILRDMKGNVLKDAGWYLEYSDSGKMQLPVYFTGKFEHSSFFTGEPAHAIVNLISDAGSTPISDIQEYTSHYIKKLIPMENPREYLALLKKEINKRSELPVEQLSKANLPVLKKAEEWMESKLEQLAA